MTTTMGDASMSDHVNYVEEEEPTVPEAVVEQAAQRSEPSVTGHDLAVQVINLLSEHRALVATVNLEMRLDGSVALSFETRA